MPHCEQCTGGSTDATDIVHLVPEGSDPRTKALLWSKTTQLCILYSVHVLKEAGAQTSCHSWHCLGMKAGAALLPCCGELAGPCQRRAWTAHQHLMSSQLALQQALGHWHCPATWLGLLHGQLGHAVWTHPGPFLWELATLPNEMLPKCLSFSTLAGMSSMIAHAVGERESAPCHGVAWGGFSRILFVAAEFSAPRSKPQRTSICMLYTRFVVLFFE